MNTAPVDLSCSWTHWIHFGPIDAPAADPGSIRTTPNSFTRPCANSRYLLARHTTGVAVLPSDIAHPAARSCRATVPRWEDCSSCTAITSAPAAATACSPATIRLVLFDFNTFQVPIRTVSSAPAAPAGNGTEVSAPVAVEVVAQLVFCCCHDATTSSPGTARTSASTTASGAPNRDTDSTSLLRSPDAGQRPHGCGCRGCGYAPATGAAPPGTDQMAAP